MGQPAVENETPFAAEALFLSDENGRPVVVPTVKATYEVRPKGLSPAEEQVAVKPEGELNGLPGLSSWKLEPECTLPKPATDVVLLGDALAPRAGTAEMVVAFQVGPLRKGVRVVGDRVFFKAAGKISMTSPAAIEKVPLRWERAYGGWDRSNPDPKKHEFEPRNPVGRGFRGSGSRFEDGLACPNLEEPADPFRGWGHHPTPAAFGFVSPDWEPRRRYAGTYDAAWEQDRKPLLPRDFDRRFLNAAPQGLVARGYLRGDEEVIASGVTRGAPLKVRLPGVPPPEVHVVRAGEADERVAMNLDTVIVDAAAMRVFLLWRGAARIREPLEVASVRVVPAPGSPAMPSA